MVGDLTFQQIKIYYRRQVLEDAHQLVKNIDKINVIQINSKV